METLSDFKIRFNDYFPVTFDTKYIAECGMMGDEVYTDTSLGALYENTVSSVMKGTTLLQYAPGFDDYYSQSSDSMPANSLQLKRLNKQQQEFLICLSASTKLLRKTQRKSNRELHLTNLAQSKMQR